MIVLGDLMYISVFASFQNLYMLFIYNYYIMKNLQKLCMMQGVVKLDSKVTYLHIVRSKR